jgi:2-phosphoglycerate kinase
MVFLNSSAMTSGRFGFVGSEAFKLERPNGFYTRDMNINRQWVVLLIGGASGVGKSALSDPLARHYGVNLVEIDDFQTVLEKTTTPEQQPLLHFWRTNWDEFSAWSDEEHLSHSIRVSQEVFQAALEAVIVNHLESNNPIILEGDFLLPQLAAQALFDGKANEGRVQSIFIDEADELQIAANYAARENEEQLGRAHSSWLYNQWLHAECERLGIPVLAARPWQAVVERVIARLG